MALEFLRDLAAAFAMGGKVAEQDKATRQRSGRGMDMFDDDRPTHKCSMCNNEPATGTRKMADGTWKRIGRKCKKAMGSNRVNQLAKKERKANKKAQKAYDKDTFHEKYPWT